jgi:C1A family cysteine protease
MPFYVPPYTQFQFYDHTIPFSSKPFDNCTNTNHNHAVLLVGMDIFGNWLIKNSWGT